MTRSQFFRTAHAITRSLLDTHGREGVSYRATFGLVLRALHRGEMDKAAAVVAICKANWNVRSVNRWTRYGKDRLYIEAGVPGQASWRSCKLYIDLTSGELCGDATDNRRLYDWAQALQERISAIYA